MESIESIYHYIEGINFLLLAYKSTISFLEGKKNLSLEAHKELNSAFIKTYDYLHNQDGIYKSNPELAEKWNNASTSVMKINKELGDLLYNKSRFWLDPNLYFKLNMQNEIPTLTEIVSEMEKIRSGIKN